MSFKLCVYVKKKVWNKLKSREQIMKLTYKVVGTCIGIQWKCV